jgi:uncharacterized membrane protein YhiD involved in acid resistance
VSAKSVIDAIAAQRDVGSVFGFEDVDAVRFVTVFARLLVSFALGALVSYRPWRALIPARRRPARPAIESVQAQTLIAVAGALMVSVIGNNMARAFGLVGLGAFIRFRSGIKDPRDAAVMFVMIGIGMACGLGNVPMGLVAAAFCGVVLALFDATGKARLHLVRAAVELADPRGELDALRAALPGARVLELPHANGDAGKVVLELAIGDDEDASSLVTRLEDHHVTGIRRVAIEEGRTNGNGG